MGRICSEETRAKIGKANKGRAPSDETREKISKTLIASIKGKQFQPNSTVRGGKREDLGDDFFRSGWEANYARYLNFIKTPYEVEKKTFRFPLLSGTLTYTPDFYLPAEDGWVEIKGRLTSKCRTKLRRFRKYFPDEFAKLTVYILDPYSKSKAMKSAMRFFVCDLNMPKERIKSYGQLRKQFGSIIPNWE